MSTKKKFFLGIDGGATKAEATIIDSTGQILGRSQQPGFMLMNRIKPEHAECLALLTAEVYKWAGVKPGEITFVVAGMCGVDFPDEHDQQWTDVAEAISFPREKTLLVNDGVAALWGATYRSQAVLLQSGTEIAAVYRSQLGQEKHFDILNMGVNFDIRRVLLTTIVRMIDGREPVTSLKTAILEFLKLPEEKFAEAIYKARILNDESLVSKEMLTRTMPVIVSQWEAGDPAAAELINAALAEYLLIVGAMLKKVGSQNIDVIFGGGLIKNTSKTFIEELLNQTKKQFDGCTAKFAELPPSVGAALLAAYTVGEEIKPLFKNVASCWRSI